MKNSLKKYFKLNPLTISIGLIGASIMSITVISCGDDSTPIPSIPDRPTIYIDEAGEEQQTDEQDLSTKNIKEITQLGYFNDDTGVIKIPIMPKEIEVFPSEIPSVVTSLDGVFNNSKLKFNSNILSAWDTSKIESMASLFQNVVGDIPDLSSWNFLNVKNMSRMFWGTSFNQDVSGWDVSNVTNMSSIFYGTTTFNQPLDGWSDKLNNLTNASGMFLSAQVFNQDLSSWNNSLTSLTNMELMFSSAKSFDASSISNWDISSVINMNYMFSFNPNFNVDLSAWGPKLGKVKYMQGMFAQSTSFNQDISSWDVSNVTDMNQMFQNALNFNNNNQPLTWGNKVSNVTDMSYMFNKTDKFNQDISNWNVSKVKNMSGMFQETFEFNNGEQPLIWGNKVNNVNDMSYMFNKAKNFNQDVSNWDVSNVTNMSGMFIGVSIQEVFNNGEKPLLWGDKVKKVTDMSYMFYNSKKFNQNISNWNVSNVTNMQSMFKRAYIFNQNISTWNVSNVENMAEIFYSAIDFNQNISNWNVNKVDFFASWNLNSEIAKHKQNQPPKFRK